MTRCRLTRGAAQLLCANLLSLIFAAPAFAGTWTRLANDSPGPVNLMLLLSDGTVMAAANDGSTIDNRWYRLKPDVHGSYINGTWSSMAAMHDNRLYYSSQVLNDGRVFVAGGEYGLGTSNAEIYDPLTNIWTRINPPAALWNPNINKFFDSNSEILPDGSVLIMPVFPHSSGVPLIYNPSTNIWSNAGKLFRGSYQDEASWVLLPDDSVLTIDPFGTNSERFIPATNTWVNDGVVPVSLYDPFGSELGAAFMLQNGKAFFLGATGHTALYTPSGTTNPGVWTAGPDIPGNHGTPDAPAAMMPTGKILCAVSPVPTSGNHFPSPTTFYEYDPTANSFTFVNAPNGTSDNTPSFTTLMLVLPNGSVLYSHFGADLYVYQPSGSPLAAGKPVIQSITPNEDGSYHLTGTGLTGISEGACYGDDEQMRTNYPLVRLSDGAGNVYYARTYNWTGASVQSGSRVLSTEYRLPANLPTANWQLVVTTNGIASDPICTTIASINGPSQQGVCEGATASLSVTATGTAPFTYQWRRGTTNLVNGGNISGADSATLMLQPAGVADSGSYTCRVTGSCGSAITVAVTLDVYPNPTFLQQPANQTASPGDSLAFSVVPGGQYFNYSYQWRKNGNLLTNGGQFSGADAQFLNIDPVQAGDAGNYDCIVTAILTGCSTISNPGILTVGGSICVGDLNGDRVVGLEDLSVLLSNYGSINATPSQGDLDGNSAIDLVDVSIMLSRYGAVCP